MREDGVERVADIMGKSWVVVVSGGGVGAGAARGTDGGRVDIWEE